LAGLSSFLISFEQPAFDRRLLVRIKFGSTSYRRLPFVRRLKDTTWQNNNVRIPLGRTIVGSTTLCRTIV
jgi:hypothetical protein